jgi:hypothetical protein
MQERLGAIVDGRGRIRNRGVKCRDSDLHGGKHASLVGLGGGKMHVHSARVLRLHGSSFRYVMSKSGS